MKVRMTRAVYAKNQDPKLGAVGNAPRKPGDIVDTPHHALLIGMKAAEKYVETEIELPVDDEPEGDDDDFRDEDDLEGEDDADEDDESGEIDAETDESDEAGTEDAGDDDSDAETEQETAEPEKAQASSAPANAPQGPKAGKKVMEFAIKNNIDLTTVKGTGNNGAILLGDVEAVLKSRTGAK